MIKLNILDFIDSKDIREYNKNTQFTPWEMAIIVYHSMNRSIEEKLKFYKYLIDNYNEKQFNYNNHFSKDFKYRDVVCNTIISIEDSLKSRYEIYNDHIFTVDGGDSDVKIFSSYINAYNFIINLKKESIDNCELKINRLKLNDTENKNTISYSFNSNMVLYDITFSPNSQQGIYTLNTYETFFIKTPFKIGDIIKVQNNIQPVYYGVLDSIKEKINNGINTFDMPICIYHINNNCFLHINDFCILDFSICPEDDLPEDQIKLIELRDAILDNTSKVCHLLIKDY